MRKKAAMLLVGLALAFAGCKGTVGPVQNHNRPQQPDPLYNSEQQQQFKRERYSLPEDNRNVTPNTYNDFPGMFGR